MKKQRIFLAAILICCLALAGGGTLAFFTARETAYNVITTGELIMDIVETHDGLPWPDAGVSGVMPGDAIDKVVTVENVGGVDFYARLKVSGTITREDGTVEMLDLDKLVIDFDASGAWIKQGDYYYYYRSLAPRGADGVVDKTEPLFTTVSLSPELGNEYQNATIEVLVEGQAVQSRNNGDSPLTAAGWDD